MKILVTGGAGYIGSTVAAELIAAGHAVTVVDNLSRGYRAAVPDGAAFVKAELADGAALGAVFAGGRFDAVLHFAALIEAGESMKSPERFFRNNTAGTMSLLEAMLEHGVRTLVFSSTAAVYAPIGSEPLNESDPLGPVNAYGESKLFVERMLAWHGRIHGLRYACLRYFNAAGATPTHGEAHRPETHLIPLVLQAAAGKRDNIAIFGSDYETPDGTCVRDYIHVSDLAAAHLLALAALGRREHLTCNLGNGRGYSVLEVIRAAERVTGKPIPCVKAERRAGDPARLVAGAEAARRELGWRPRYAELETIIDSAWRWMLAHPHGYEPR